MTNNESSETLLWIRSGKLVFFWQVHGLKVEVKIKFFAIGTVEFEVCIQSHWGLHR